MGHKAVCQLHQKIGKAFTEMLRDDKQQAEQASNK
jgi:hypothetical protein